MGGAYTLLSLTEPLPLSPGLLPPLSEPGTWGSGWWTTVFGGFLVATPVFLCQDRSHTQLSHDHHVTTTATG